MVILIGHVFLSSQVRPGIIFPTASSPKTLPEPCYMLQVKSLVELRKKTDVCVVILKSSNSVTLKFTCCPSLREQ